MFELRPFVWAATLMAVCIISALRGGAYERLAAGGLMAGWAFSMLVQQSQWRQTEWGILSVDVALMAFLVWIALRSPRHWPMFAAGFHLLAIITHLARGVDSTVGGWAYFTAEILWGYLLAFAIGYGAWTAPRYAGMADPSEVPGATRR